MKFDLFHKHKHRIGTNKKSAISAVNNMNEPFNVGGFRALCASMDKQQRVLVAYEIKESRNVGL